ncbi:hypothetical protein [Nocardioides sambongensis]|uniref:hypothetical protein n=1 Tax=Nocardioides sambongensis TaxID=2589074 RepID=UPI00112DF444|nr:hypothetical protein [Nocardioides sambongensis]
MTDYEVYGGDQSPTPRYGGPGEGPWRVVIEYANGGQAKPPTVVKVGRSVFVERAEAWQAARKAAFEFKPPDPWSPSGREVFQDGPDGFLVVIQGASTKQFHMTVRLVQPIDRP